MEYKPDNPEARLAFRLLWILPIVLVIVLAIALSLDLPLLDFMKQLLPSFVWNFELVKSLPNNCFPTSLPNNANIIEVESCSAIIRNFGLMIGIGLSFIVAVFGLLLALWGRITQRGQWKTEEKKLDLENKQWELQQRQLEIQDKQQELRKREKLQERFEKASDMLASDAELTRIGACRSLVDLGKADESMKSRCVRLLFAFINNPYLEINDKGKSLDELFPAGEPLRSDIQEAISSFSVIYEYYGEDSIDDEAISLPSYFWKNKFKGNVFLIKANLQEKNMEKAHLNRANFRGASLQHAKLNEATLINVDFRKAKLNSAHMENANLHFAILSPADLSHANLLNANLTSAFLVQADLEHAMLAAVNLSNADSRYANFHEAILHGVNFHKAQLWGANFQKATLKHVNFKGANLYEADFQGADISSADMREAGNLTKEQILSAKWGYEIFGHGAPPQLPEDLMQDEDIKKWLETPTYDERKSKDSE